MTIEITVSRKAPARTQLSGRLVTKEAASAKTVEGLDWEVLESRGFDGSVGQVFIISGEGTPRAVIGVGPREEVNAVALRRGGVAFVRAAKRLERVAADVLGDEFHDLGIAEAAQAFAEGVVLGAYGFGNHKTDFKANKVKKVTIAGASGKRVSDAVARGTAIAEAVNLARDLVNEPGGTLTPIEFARHAAAVAKSSPRLSVKILDAAGIKRAKMGGLLGVNRGSVQQPRFVEMTYQPVGKAKKHLALVGKGITFDSGGLSIKPAAGMMTMKCDMGGAAAVLGAMSALATTQPQIKVSAYLPMTDNMLGGDATRPGDVLKISNGKTVEVLNTDAEGRLVLADALSSATSAKPDAIVDLATLTGACMVALGPQYAGVMGTNQDLVEMLLGASGRTGERVWQLPLPDEYRPMLDSTVADIKNIGGAFGGALTAGLFLREFVGDDIPWAHIDIAGPAFTESAWDEHPKGATGYGVRLLVDLADNFA